MHPLILIILLLLNFASGEEVTIKKPNITCSDYRLYTGLNVTAVQGVWKARELVLHEEEGGQIVYRQYKSCPVINITITSDQGAKWLAYRPTTEASPYASRFSNNWYKEYRHLRLVWDENGRSIEYSLFFKNDSVGFWASGEGNTGNYPSSSSYHQFTGSVQVLKAVGDHLLLHFCQAPVDGHQAQLFSVLLSRKPKNLQRWEIDSAHELLRRKNLSVTTIRVVCGNSASKFLAHFGTLVLTAVMIFITST